eukprot:2528246-Amphidinium_carterae.2
MAQELPQAPRVDGVDLSVTRAFIFLLRTLPAHRRHGISPQLRSLTAWGVDSLSHHHMPDWHAKV